MRNDEGRWLTSIVLYGSNVFCKQACQDGNLDKCPMAILRKENGVKVDTIPIISKLMPSKGDVEFIRKYYPWVGDETKVEEGAKHKGPNEPDDNSEMPREQRA